MESQGFSGIYTNEQVFNYTQINIGQNVIVEGDEPLENNPNVVNALTIYAKFIFLLNTNQKYSSKIAEKPFSTRTNQESDAYQKFVDDLRASTKEYLNIKSLTGYNVKTY
jgi:hypothetical protein